MYGRYISKNEQNALVQVTTASSGLRFCAKPKFPISVQHPNKYLAPCRPLPFFLSNSPLSSRLAGESFVYVHNQRDKSAAEKVDVGGEEKLCRRNNRSGGKANSSQE